MNKNYKTVNAENQVQDEDSIFSYYKKLVQLRKDVDVIAYGDINPLDAKHPSVFAYERTYENENLVVVCNFYKNEVVWDSKMDLSQYEVLLSNYSEQNIENGKITLKPYEAVMLYRK